MAFAGRCGLSINLDILTLESEHAMDWGDAKNWAGQVPERRNELTLRALFNEELGAVIQIRAADRSAVMDVLRQHQLGACSHILGKPNTRQVLEFARDGKQIYQASRVELQQAWSEPVGASPVCVTTQPAPMQNMRALRKTMQASVHGFCLMHKKI